MLMVVSPAKSLDFESPAQSKKFTEPRFLADSKKLVSDLKKLKPEEISELMNISETLGELNFARYANWQMPFDLKNSKQAIFAFKGDVYNGINAPTLSTEDLDFAQDKVRMLSGLYGVIRPLDLIQPYRLEMGTKLSNAKGNDLYDYWGSDISDVLNDDESELIINLASIEYFKAIDKKSLNAKILDIVFKEKKGDSYKVIGIYAKRARGLMVNFIIRNRLDNPEALKDFSDEGYRFDRELSNDSTWVYLRG